MGIGTVDNQQIDPSGIGPEVAEGDAPGASTGSGVPGGVAAPGGYSTQAAPGVLTHSPATTDSGRSPGGMEADDTYVSNEIGPDFGSLMPVPSEDGPRAPESPEAAKARQNLIDGVGTVGEAQHGELPELVEKPKPYDGLDPEFAAQVKSRTEAKIQALVEETEPIIHEEFRVTSYRTRVKVSDDWVMETRYIMHEGSKSGDRVQYDSKNGVIKHGNNYYRAYTNDAGELMAVTKEVTPQQQVAGMLAGKEGFEGPTMDDLLFESVVEAQRDGYSPVPADATTVDTASSTASSGSGSSAAHDDGSDRDSLSVSTDAGIDGESATAAVDAAEGEVRQADYDSSRNPTDAADGETPGGEIRQANFSVSPRVPDSSRPSEDPGSVWGLRVTFGDDGVITHELTGETVPYDGGSWSDVFDNVEHFADAVGLGGVYDAVEGFALDVADIDVVDVASGAWEGVSKAAGDFWGNVTEAWEGAKEFAGEAWDAAKEFFSGGKSQSQQREDFDNSQDRRDNLSKDGIDPSVRDDPDNTGPGGIL